MVYGRRRGFVNPNPNRRNIFPNSIRDQRGGYSNLDEFFNSISSLDGSHDIESTFLCIEKVDKLFDMEYITIEDHVEFMAYKFKRRTAAW